MAINARGYFLRAREAIRTMLSRRSGAIVNVASLPARSKVLFRDKAAMPSSISTIKRAMRIYDGASRGGFCRL